MRWLLDQGIPRWSAKNLRQSQEDAVHTGDIGMAKALDLEVIQHAIKDNRIIVTLDSDFHTLLAVMGASKPSIIRIREEGLKGQQVAELVLQIARQLKPELDRGCVITFHGGKIRYRNLPI